MNNNEISMQCTYAKTGPELEELIDESFRLFLIRTLAQKTSEVVSYPR